MSFFDFGGLETSRCPGSESSIPSENGRSDEMGVEEEQATIAIERSTEASWGERPVFEPDSVPHQESTQPVSVRPFFSPSVEHPMADPVLPRQSGTSWLELPPDPRDCGIPATRRTAPLAREDRPTGSQPWYAEWGDW